MRTAVTVVRNATGTSAVMATVADETLWIMQHAFDAAGFGSGMYLMRICEYSAGK